MHVSPLFVRDFDNNNNQAGGHKFVSLILRTGLTSRTLLFIIQPNCIQPPDRWTCLEMNNGNILCLSSIPRVVEFGSSSSGGNVNFDRLDPLMLEENLLQPPWRLLKCLARRAHTLFPKVAFIVSKWNSIQPMRWWSRRYHLVLRLAVRP